MRAITCVSFSEEADLRRIKRIAKRLNVTTSAFIAEAALKEAAAREGKCAECGTKHVPLRRTG